MWTSGKNAWSAQARCGVRDRDNQNPGKKERAGMGEGRGPHHSLSKVRDFFYTVGYHDLTPTMEQAVLRAIYITYFYLLSPSQQPCEVYSINIHILQPRKAM